MPCDNSALRAKATQRTTYTVGPQDLLPKPVEKLLFKLLEKEYIFACEVEVRKQKLASCYDFHMDHVYHEIDDCNLRFIDACALKRFMQKVGHFPTDKFLIAIIRRLDLDADAKLSQKELFEGILPLEPFTRSTIGAVKHLKVRKVVKKRPATAKKVMSKTGKVAPSVHVLNHDPTPSFDEDEYRHKEESKLESQRMNSASKTSYHSRA